MLFSKVIGHAGLKAKLIGNIREGRVPHAQLYHGPRGSGNLAIALGYAQYLLCEAPDLADACGRCPACKQAAKLEHPDLHFAFPIVLTDKVKTCDPHLPAWRAMVLAEPHADLDRWRLTAEGENKQFTIGVDIALEIQRKLSFKAFRGGWKVMVLWLPEAMNPQAANKLLKVLEEPEPHTAILLVCHQADALLPTILSRTQQVFVPALAPTDVAGALRARSPDLEDDEAMRIALRSDGDLLEAVSMAEKGEEELFVFFRDWLRACHGARIGVAAEFGEGFARMGREKQKALMRYGLHLLRQCVYQWQRVPELVRAFGQEEEFTARFGALLTEGNIGPIRQELETAHLHVERNANPKLLFMDLSYRMMGLLRKGR
jgi:DNA polymerase-3 subunit delta'